VSIIFLRTGIAAIDFFDLKACFHSRSVSIIVLRTGIAAIDFFDLKAGRDVSTLVA
jgi:hypothetical protein